MIEFEKWWENLGIVYQSNPLIRPKDRTKKGFRVALEWVKQTMIDNADQETLSFSDIEKELG